MIESEAALAQARTIDLPGSARLAELDRVRARVALREARARLDALERLGSDALLGEALTLLQRSRTDPVLATLAAEIEARVAEAQSRRVEADALAARLAIDQGRAGDAFDAAERWHAHAGDLPGPEARRAEADARSVIEGLVSRFGIALTPTSGRFVLGSGEGYDQSLSPPLVELCRLKGYLPPPRADSPWHSSWDSLAPYRLTLQVAESQQGYYLQSKNRTMEIGGSFEFLVGGRTTWRNRVVASTTQPLPGLRAYQAGRLATADHRDPAVERRLHEDALAQFVEQSARILRGLPAPDRSAPPL